MNYFETEQHKQNAKLGLEVARKQLKVKEEERHFQYSLDPTKCLFCNSILDYKDKNKKFCSKSCAAKYNNKLRVPRNKESREVTSKTLKEKYEKGILIPTKFFGNKFGQKYDLSLSERVCEICSSKFIVKCFDKRKTCSSECRTKLIFKSRKYQNGKRKNILYNNKIQGEVLLESSWEFIIAEFLDNLNINWIRPEPIRWFDDSNKKHLYYPDFFLVDYNIYLDPKNPYCMQRDKNKLEQVSKEIKLIYGDVNKLKDIIKTLVLNQ